MNEYYFGMHLIWWLIWIFLIIWIFLTPYNFSVKKRTKEDPLEILRRRYALGEIDTKEFEEKNANISKTK